MVPGSPSLPGSIAAIDCRPPPGGTADRMASGYRCGGVAAAQPCAGWEPASAGSTARRSRSRSGACSGAVTWWPPGWIAGSEGKDSRSIEQAGGRVVGLWWTQGAYDAVLVSEWPDDESASVFALSYASMGNVRTETVRAYTNEEMQRILQRLP